MKELITEEQANWIILFLSIAITIAALGAGFYFAPKVEKKTKKLHWANFFLFAAVGPVTWVFWQVYNSIENYYGLDSLKALEINFCIAIGLGFMFFVLFQFLPRWIPGATVPKRRK